MLLSDLLDGDCIVVLSRQRFGPLDSINTTRCILIAALRRLSVPVLRSGETDFDIDTDFVEIAHGKLGVRQTSNSSPLSVGESHLLVLLEDPFLTT